ncbi:MAG TPA: hypothetical protein VFE90_19975 [Myxococcales bacterium]|nr:hypothetical protein [Myxococcales bacterium]
MQLDFTGRVARARWVFVPLGLCALAAVGAHAAADVVGDRVLWLVDGVDAFFDALWSKWSLTAPLVDLVGLTQRTWFARAVALAWELAADALVAVPLLGYDERDAAREWGMARDLLRRIRSPLRAVPPLATLLVSVAGACSVARMVQGSVQLALHLGWFSWLLRTAVLLAMLILLTPRAVFRSLEHTAGRRRAAFSVLAAVLLIPLMVAAVLSYR